jgi:Pyruvate/2-oxoacid:ferredoxin oxidoreductase delta subunit
MTEKKRFCENCLEYAPVKIIEKHDPKYERKIPVEVCAFCGQEF